MKKVLAVLLTLVLIASFSSCAKGTGGKGADSPFTFDPIGTWHYGNTVEDRYENEIIISQINGRKIIFSVSYYRLWGADDVLAVLEDDGKAYFNIEDGAYEGNLLISENEIQFTLTKSSSDYVPIGTFKYIKNSNARINFEEFKINDDVINSEDMLLFQFADITVRFDEQISTFIDNLSSKSKLEFTTTYNPQSLVQANGETKFTISFRDVVLGDWIYEVTCKNYFNTMTNLAQTFLYKITPLKLEYHNFYLPSEIDMREFLFKYIKGVCAGDNYIDAKNKLATIKNIKISSEREIQSKEHYRQMSSTVSFPYEFNGTTKYMKLYIYFDADSGIIMNIRHQLNSNS